MLGKDRGITVPASVIGARFEEILLALGASTSSK